MKAMEAIERYFAVVMFVMLYNVVLPSCDAVGILVFCKRIYFFQV